MNLTELHRQVIRKDAGGKIIWQPRIDCWIQDRLFKDGKLPQPYTGMTKSQIFRELGCSARIYEFNGCFQRVYDPKVKSRSRKLSETETEHVLDTPVGKLTSVTATTSTSWAEITKKWWVTSEEELKVASWLEEHCEWKWDQQHYQQTYDEWKGLGLPTVYMPRVNIQHLYIDMMGVQEAIYAITDYPQTVDAYFQVLDESHSRLIDVINASPIDVINFGDNIHCGTLPASLFETYVLPAYQRRNEQLHKAQNFTHAHWDGDTKTLLPYAKDCGLDGIEAITPKPQGDVTLKEVKQALGDDVFLIDGIAALLFDASYSEQELEDQTREIIDLFAPKLILGISDEISSTGDIDRIKLVGRIVDAFNSGVGYHD